PMTGSVDFNDRCLENTNGVPITWYKYPDAKIGGPNLLTCTLTSISLDAGNSVSGSGDPLKYKWSNGDSTSFIITSLPGTFTVTVTDSKSKCTSVSNFTVNRMVDLPKVIIDSALKFTCDRNTVTLTGNKSDMGPNYQAFWKGTGTNSYTTTVNKPGRYTLVVENKLTNCRDSLDILVGVDTLPPIAKIAQVGTLGCVVKQVKLNGFQSTGSSGVISSYNWSGNIISGQNTSSVTIGSPGGKFILTVKDSKNGCIDTDSIDVVEESNPLDSIISMVVNPDCFGKTNGQIVVDKVFDKNGNSVSGLLYSINNGPFASRDTFSNLANGTYTITVKDTLGCILSTRNVVVEPQVLDIKVHSTVIVDQGTIIDIDTLLLGIFGGTTNGFGEYKDTTWFNVFDSKYLTNLIYQADTTSEFIITGIDESGCIVSKSVRVIVRIVKEVWWPNVFNPNSSLSENAKFNLYGKRVRNIRIINIYSRWGELVFSSENFQDANKIKGFGWDGMFRGQK
ncbi:MAG: hypothetical protein ABIO44_01625, partial [Saprospiraceae bacterium]